MVDGRCIPGQGPQRSGSSSDNGVAVARIWDIKSSSIRVQTVRGLKYVSTELALKKDVPICALAVWTTNDACLKALAVSLQTAALLAMTATDVRELLQKSVIACQKGRV